MDCAKRDKLANKRKLFRQTGLQGASFLPKRDPGNELGSRNVERALIRALCVIDLFKLIRFSDFFSFKRKSLIRIRCELKKIWDLGHFMPGSKLL